MLKLSKLVTKPDMFFRDMIKKRRGDTIKDSNNKKQPDKSEKVNIVSKTPKLAEKDKKKNITNNLAKNEPKMITTNIRLFTKINHLIHTGEGINCSFHIEQWIGEFIASNERFALLIRDINLYNWAITQYPNVDIVYAKSAIAVEQVLNQLPYLKAIYYLSNTGNLIHTLRYNIYQHIFLGHGDSDKAASAHKFFRVYDEIWVAGQAHIDRFKNAGFNVEHIKFVKVGRPSLKQIVKQSVSNNNVTEHIIKTLTYFPTWEGAFEENNYSSARLSPIFLSELQQKLNCKIVAKYHPLTGSRDKTLETIQDALQNSFIDRSCMLSIANKSEPIPNLVVNSDLFICDISAVVSECISSLSPIFIYIPEDRNVITSGSDMHYSDYAYTFSNIEQLMQLIENIIINGNDHLAEARYKALDYLLSVNETVNDAFLSELKRISSTVSEKENKREFVIQ